MAVVIDPIDTAVGVVASPVERAWNGIVNYNDLESENEALQEEVDRLIGTQVSGEAAVLQAQEILALNNLPALAGIPTELAQVVGGAANNIDQIIEINKGQRSGIEIGMPVVNQAGLIGKVTSVTETSARVMLVTDPRYAVGVTVTAALDETATPSGTGDEPVTTSPSGLTPEEIAAETEHHDDLHDRAGRSADRSDHDGRRLRVADRPADARHDAARSEHRTAPELRRPRDR